MQFLWRQALGPEGHEPYLIRWVADFGWFSIRLHHWLHSDDQRFPHDHAWDFWSLVLSGQLTDRTPEGSSVRTRGDLSFFSAEHKHCVQVDRPAWTLLLTGPERRRNWGFWCPRSDTGEVRLFRREKYFRRYGHHDPQNPYEGVVSTGDVA